MSTTPTFCHRATCSCRIAAAHEGGLVSLTSVLASLYPIVTVLLAAAVLHETLARWQWIGVGLTLAGVGLIAA